MIIPFPRAMLRRFPLLLVGLLACRPIQPLERGPEPVREPGLEAAPVFIAPPELAPFVFTPAEIARAEEVPSFSREPLARWGGAPSGISRTERVRTYDLRHQATTLRIQWDPHRLTGTTTLTIAALDRPIGSVTLDAVGMNITRVTAADGRNLPFNYNGRSLSISLPNTLRADNSTTRFTVEYQTGRTRKGFYFIDRTRSFWTQGEPEDTRYWVPTYDYPNDKTTWEFRVIVPRGQKALSNGRLVGTRELPEGTEWHWSLEKPASTYLMSVAGGTYEILNDRHGSVPVNYWTYPDSIEPAQRGFGKTPRMMDVFERRIGVPYPWAKYDQIVVPDFVFEGMENVSATTQKDDRILWPRSDEPLKNSDALVAHELAHQWFGNLLTLRDWSHAWLNEGFANFLETIYYEDAGEAERAALDRRESIENALIADRRARRPLVYNRWNEDPIELFLSGHIYPKGAAVLQMIRREVGDSLFWRAINDYATRNAFGSVITEDLRVSLERATGRDFRTFFQRWIYGAGFPAFRVSYRYEEDSRRLTVSAEEVQPRDALTDFFDPEVGVEVLTDSGAIPGVVAIRGGRGSVTLELPAPPRAITWDKGNWLIDVADFPRPTAMLVHQLLYSDDVSARHDAMEELAQRTQSTYALAAITRTARVERYWSTRVAAIHALSAFRADTLVRDALLEISGDPDPRVRAAVAGALRRHGGADVNRRLVELAETDTSRYVRAAARSVPEGRPPHARQANSTR